MFGLLWVLFGLCDDQQVVEQIEYVVVMSMLGECGLFQIESCWRYERLIGIVSA